MPELSLIFEQSFGLYKVPRNSFLLYSAAQI